MEQVTGIGGFFFGAQDPAGLTRWYAEHLGVDPTPESYDVLPWWQESGPTIFASSQPADTPWMMNFRVRDLDAMVAQLRASGIDVDVDAQTYPNGRFAALADPEGNGLQLWEPAGLEAGGEQAAGWLPSGFSHPLRVDLPTGHHLRPIRADDVDLDLPAVMGSRERLWRTYGEAWGWPPEAMTREQDRDDLARHERENTAHESFNYALFDEGETALLGCVYIDPAPEPDVDADVSWWVVDDLVGSPVEQALDHLVPRWLAEEWPLPRVRYPFI